MANVKSTNPFTKEVLARIKEYQKPRQLGIGMEYLSIGLLLFLLFPAILLVRYMVERAPEYYMIIYIVAGAMVLGAIIAAIRTFLEWKAGAKEIREWIQKYGSERLKLLVKTGMEYTQDYALERAARDFPTVKEFSENKRGLTNQLKKLDIPHLQALDLLRNEFHGKLETEATTNGMAVYLPKLEVWATFPWVNLPAKTAKPKPARQGR